VTSWWTSCCVSLASDRAAINDLGSAYVPTASGRVVPLTQVVRIGHGWEPGVLWRENRQFAVTVQGDVVDGMQGATVSGQLAPAMEELKRRMPPGYTITVAGAVEESGKGQGSIAVGVPMMLFLIFTLLMLQLQSFSRSMLVFLTGPMGIAGVAGALLLLDRPFGFVALLGVIALMGMIMRNSVILIDQIEQDRANGVSCLGRGGRVGGAALPPDRADGGRGGAGDDPAVAQRVLGSDGGGHHGRPDRRHRADPAGPAGDVRGLVPGAPRR
jgi:multidrug efflux pump subunit AcrB